MTSSIFTASSQGKDDSEISTPPVCKCGMRAKSKRSTTAANPGRRFYGCILYGKQVVSCIICLNGMFKDPPVEARNDEMLADLVGKLKRMDEQRCMMDEKIRLTDEKLRMMDEKIRRQQTREWRLKTLLVGSWAMFLCYLLM
ncbi:hypothetical protein CJ030_MR0G008007 [Morella rubra]|uniref:Zinc finger GRF-type domain-containing protein n=1 Tax=Morella rubra TaxID=262757 RepID=A0A6A1UIQ5_9ROSI|nr:hypothetical protein CJ030_MR0G008007 [Morella rubra]